MGMDLLRSCYRTRMRFDPSQPAKSSPVTWYFCPPGARVFPGAHSFVSLNWYKGQGLPDAPIGELSTAARPWSNGATPAEAKGQTACAPPAAFLNGLPYLLSPRSEYPDGFPMCCNLVSSGLFLDRQTISGFTPGCFTGGSLYNTISILITASPGTVWSPFVGTTYVLTRSIPFSPPYTWSNPGSGGGLGLKIQLLNPGSPCGLWFTAGGCTGMPGFLGTALTPPQFFAGGSCPGFPMGMEITAVT